MRFTRTLLLVSLLALIVAPIALAIRFTDEDFNLPVAETGKNYNFQLTGAGGCGPALPYQFSLLGSATPPGITMDSSGLLHGAPTTPGDYHFWVDLSDQNPPSQSWCRPNDAQRELEIKVVQGLLISQRQSNLAPGQLGVPYTLQFTATGGNPTWSVVTNSGALPVGLSLSSTGMLSGTPTAAGDYHFKVQAVDGTRSDVQTYNLSVAPQLKVTSPTRAAAEMGRPFQFSLTAEGGRTAYSWTAAGLPDGLSLDGRSGAITGTPTTVGLSDVKVTITDSIGLTSTVDLKLNVAAPLQIAKRGLPGATVGNAYTARLHVLGGVRPLRWTILRGKLPAGIQLNARTGALTGTPTKAGTAHVTISVTDKLGAVSRARFVLKVG